MTPVGDRSGRRFARGEPTRPSAPEIRTLLLKVVWPHAPAVRRTLEWSVRRRRRRQHRARAKPPDDEPRP